MYLEFGIEYYRFLIYLYVSRVLVKQALNIQQNSWKQESSLMPCKIKVETSSYRVLITKQYKSIFVNSPKYPLSKPACFPVVALQMRTCCFAKKAIKSDSPISIKVVYYRLAWTMTG